MPTLSGHGWPFIGTWSSSVSYSRGDVVLRSGVLYQAVSDVKGTDPLPVGPQWVDVSNVVMALTGSVDPTAGSGIPTAVGTTYQYAGSGLHVKTDSGGTEWTNPVLPPGAHRSIDLLFTEIETPSYPIVGIVIVEETPIAFQIAGDHTARFNGVHGNFVIAGSTGNDGAWSCSGQSTYADGVTTITVGEPISDTTVDGDLLPKWITYTASVDIPAGATVIGVDLFVHGVFDAELVELTDADGSHEAAYYSSFDLTGISGGTYDPTGTAGSDSWAAGNGGGTYGASAAIPSSSGVGVRYATADTITVQVDTRKTAPPTTPTGVLRARYTYVLAPGETEAVAS